MVGAVSLSWACGPSGYGVPESPSAPPSSTAQPTAPPASAQPPAASGAPTAPVAGSEAASGSPGRGPGSPRSSQPRSGTAPQRVGGVGGVGGGGNTSTGPATRADIDARVGGSTAGVVQQGGQQVFASSAAPRSAKPKGKAAKKAAPKSSARTNAAPPSQRSAIADLWSGVSSGPDLASAASAAGTGGGLSGAATAAIAILGLGLAALTGAVLVTGRRRRAEAAAGAPKNQ